MEKTRKSKTSKGSRKKTRVVCVKVANIRPKYNNLREWMEDSNNVYIGRRGIVFIDGKRFPPRDSIWANSFKIDTEKRINDGTREEVLEKYEDCLRKILKKNPVMVNELLDLKNKRLGCWCHSLKFSELGGQAFCHGDILMKLLKEYDNK